MFATMGMLPAWLEVESVDRCAAAIGRMAIASSKRRNQLNADAGVGLYIDCAIQWFAAMKPCVTFPTFCNQPQGVQPECGGFPSALRNAQPAGDHLRRGGGVAGAQQVDQRLPAGCLCRARGVWRCLGYKVYIAAFYSVLSCCRSLAETTCWLRLRGARCESRPAAAVNCKCCFVVNAGFNQLAPRLHEPFLRRQTTCYAVLYGMQTLPIPTLQVIVGNAPMRLSPYLAYSDANTDEMPLYMFDKVRLGIHVRVCVCGGKAGGGRAAASLCRNGCLTPAPLQHTPDH